MKGARNIVIKGCLWLCILVGGIIVGRLDGNRIMIGINDFGVKGIDWIVLWINRGIVGI